MNSGFSLIFMVLAVIVIQCTGIAALWFGMIVPLRKKTQQHYDDLKAIIDNVPAIIACWDDQLCNKFMSKTFEQYFSTSRELAKGKHIREVIGDQLYRRALPYLQKALSGEEQSYDVKKTDVEGEIFYFNVSYVPIMKNGKVTSIIALVLDVTERRMMEEAIFVEKERFRIMLESITDAVVTTDESARVLHLNPVAEALSGWSDRDAHGHPVDIVMPLVSDEKNEEIEHPVRVSLRDKRVASPPMNASLIRKDGHLHAVDSSAAPVCNRNGTTIGAALVLHDVEDARRIAQQVAYQATHDVLTGLYNRREFERLAGELFASSRRSSKSHVLMFMDLDRFKSVNDTAGHLAGDELLQKIARLMANELRESDVLARLGGDEFVALLENCSIEQANHVAQRINQAVRGHLFAYDSRTYTVGVSIGMARITAQVSSLAQVLAEADAACYRSKQGKIS